MKSINIIGLTLCLFVGCQSESERLKAIARETLEERIKQHEYKEQAYITEFELPNERRLLDSLNNSSGNWLERPVVLFGHLAPNATPPNERVPGSLKSLFDHYIHLVWFEDGRNVNGFYIETSFADTDHKVTYVFDDVIDQSTQYFKDLEKDGPERDDTFALSVQNRDRKQKLFIWPEGLQAAIGNSDVKLGIGLIMRDGSMTPPGPLRYQAAP